MESDSAPPPSTDSPLPTGPRTATTRRGKKILQSKQPQQIEPPKSALILRSLTAKSDVRKLLSELHILRKPLSLFLQKHHSKRFSNLLPFDEMSPVETLCKRHNATLFIVGDSNKKHPFRLTFGRLFDFSLLDMFEFDVLNYKPIEEFRSKEVLSPAVGSKPLLLLQGSAFEASPVMQQLKNYFCDYFGGVEMKSISLQDIDRAIVVTAYENDSDATGSEASSYKLMFQHFRIVMKKSGGNIPRIQLHEVGPHFEMKLLRYSLPTDEVMKTSLKQPKAKKILKVKNVKTNELGQTIGRVHVGKADFTALHTPHYHGEGKDRKRRKMGETTKDK